MAILNNKLYDGLKWVALIFAPALATLVALLGTVWGWDEAVVTGVVATITGLSTFLGALLGISSAQYKAKQ